MIYQQESDRPDDWHHISTIVNIWNDMDGSPSLAYEDLFNNDPRRLAVNNFLPQEFICL